MEETGVGKRVVKKAAGPMEVKAWKGGRRLEETVATETELMAAGVEEPVVGGWQEGGWRVDTAVHMQTRPLCRSVAGTRF